MYLQTGKADFWVSLVLCNVIGIKFTTNVMFGFPANPTPFPFANLSVTNHTHICPCVAIKISLLLIQFYTHHSPLSGPKLSSGGRSGGRFFSTAKIDSSCLSNRTSGLICLSRLLSCCFCMISVFRFFSNTRLAAFRTAHRGPWVGPDAVSSPTSDGDVCIGIALEEDDNWATGWSIRKESSVRTG